MKTIKHLSATLLALLATIVIALPFTACSNDDNEGDTPELPNKMLAHNLTFKATIHQPEEGSNFVSITDKADVTLHCVDQNGKETTKAISASEGQGEIKIENKSYPCEYHFYITFDKKPDATFDPAAKYYVNVEYGYSSVQTYSNSDPMTISSSSLQTPKINFSGLDNTKAEDMCTRQFAKQTFKFDANGKYIKD